MDAICVENDMYGILNTGQDSPSSSLSLHLWVCMAKDDTFRDFRNSERRERKYCWSCWYVSVKNSSSLSLANVLSIHAYVVQYF